tara:strand:- start:269 stop:562 length:294 start_codon:yes stop_codon:yes gene_type:complete
MISYTHLDKTHDMSTLYNNWLVQNFNQSINTNIFQPIYEDDMDIIHDTDPYDYMMESFEYTNAFDDEMFNEPPNIELYDHDEEDNDNFDSYDYARNV